MSHLTRTISCWCLHHFYFRDLGFQATGTSASTATRLDYNTFHKAVEALLIPASDQTRQAVFVPGPISVTPAAAGAADSRRVDTVMQRADMDQGLEFEGDDPTLRAAKRDVCRKVRTQLQSHLTMPRKAFLTVDKNRDGLLSRQELRR